MRTRWIVTGVLGALTALGGAVAGAVYLLAHGEDTSAAHLALVDELMTASAYADAAAMIRRHGEHTGSNADKWWAHDLASATALSDVPRLSFIARHRPDLMPPGGRARLLVARAAVTLGDYGTAATAIATARSAEMESAGWYALAIDLAEAQGDRDARARLAPTQQDPARFHAIWWRRTALQAATPSEALDALKRAFSADPSDAESLVLAANIHESEGNTAASLRALLSACALEPQQPLWWDRLGSFQLRHGRPDQAIAAWNKGLQSKAPGHLALRSAFWQHITTGRIDLPETIPTDPLGQLAIFLHKSIGSDATHLWWDTTAWNAYPGRHPGLARRAEIGWLRIIGMLKAGNESEALALLDQDRRQLATLDPALWDTLRRLLTWRTTGYLPVPTPGHLPQPRHHTFLQRLGGWTANDEMMPGVQQSFVPALVFLAVGWRAVATDLLAEAPAEALPSWAAYGLARCHLMAGDPATASTYLEAHLTDRPCQLLLAMINLPDRPDQATACLIDLAATADDAVAERASWLLANRNR